MSHIPVMSKCMYIYIMHMYIYIAWYIKTLNSIYMYTSYTYIIYIYHLSEISATNVTYNFQLWKHWIPAKEFSRKAEWVRNRTRPNSRRKIAFEERSKILSTSFIQMLQDVFGQGICAALLFDLSTNLWLSKIDGTRRITTSPKFLPVETATDC